MKKRYVMKKSATSEAVLSVVWERIGEDEEDEESVQPTKVDNQQPTTATRILMPPTIPTPHDQPTPPTCPQHIRYHLLAPP